MIACYLSKKLSSLDLSFSFVLLLLKLIVEACPELLVFCPRHVEEHCGVESFSSERDAFRLEVADLDLDDFLEVIWHDRTDS